MKKCISILFLLVTALAAQKISAQPVAIEATQTPATTVVPAATVEKTLPQEEPQPWRLGKALLFPEWLVIGFNHRSRYEGLTNQFRTGASSDEPIYALRTLFSAEAKWNQFALKAELIDSRVYFASPVTPLDPTFVDTFDILQSYAEGKFPALFSNGDELRVRGGRFTMDLGNRRLVARNRYRNTINSFTGLESEYKFASDDRLRLFATMPVQRVPDNLNDIQSNMAKLDFQSTNVLFGGLYYENRSLVKNFVAEFYTLGLSEDDTPDLLTKNRHLLTPGLRAYVPAKPDSFDFEIEGAGQAGTSRATTKASDTTDLQHLAYFMHASAGYSLRQLGQTRVSLEYQYASGNPSSNGGKMSRFDPLYGARRSMFGPTGLYGAIALSNINTPGVRVEIKPTATVRTFAAYRAIWLADGTDAWTVTGLQDKSGASGAFLGHQIEGEVIWNILPGNVSVEAGFACLSLGGFPRNLNKALQDPVYVFLGMVLDL